MFKKPVVFIIGAGASADYGMPLGGTLAAKIAEDTNFAFEEGFPDRPKKGDADLYDLLQARYDAAAIKRYLIAGQKLTSALSSAVSIDDALYQLSEIPEAIELGKICIVRSILWAEANSLLRPVPPANEMPLGAGKDGWIEQMFSMAITNYRLSELRQAFKNVTFINFNYDRCLEQYLFWSLQRIGLSEIEAEKIVEDLSIIRPYGTLGSILPSALDNLGFGHVSDRKVFETIGRIRTYTESEALHDKRQLRRVLSEASMYIVLGFGFHRQNLELLSVLQSMPFHDKAQVLATVYQVHEGNLDQLRSALQSTLKVKTSHINLVSMSAPDMLRELRLRITIATN